MSERLKSQCVLSYKFSNAEFSDDSMDIFLSYCIRVTEERHGY